MTIDVWMLQNTLAAGLLALVIAAVCRLGKFSPAVRHALWLIVLLKLITPPIFEFPLPISTLGMSPRPVRSAEAVGGRTLVRIAAEQFYDFTLDESVMPAAEPPAAAGATNLLATIRATDAIQHSERRDAPSGIEPASSAIPSADSIRTGVQLVWLCGTLLFVTIQGWRLLNLRRIQRGGSADSGWLSAVVVDAARQFSVLPPRVLIVSDLPSPALCALGPVCLLWPEGMQSGGPGSGTRAVVLHELAHLRRRDHWIGWLELIAGCAWWWNPLFWYVRHQLHENAELACDAWVVALLPDSRRAYAEALLEAAQGDSGVPTAPALLGVADGSRKLMERRLIMIMRDRMRYQIPALGLVVIAVVAVVTIPQWSVGQPTIDGFTSVDAAVLGTEAPVPAGESLLVDGVEGRAEESVLPSALPDDPFAEQAGSVVGNDANPFANKSTIPLPAPVQATSAPPAEPTPDQVRIKRLEQLISHLNEEIKTLRRTIPNKPRSLPEMPASKPSPWAPDRPTASHPAIAEPGRRLPSVGDDNYSLPTAPATDRSAANPVPWAPGKPIPPHPTIAGPGTRPSVDPEDPGVETIVMTRSTYKLPPGRALVIERALRELLNDDVEIKVKNDSLQITAAQEDQSAIYHLIRLMQRKGRVPARLEDSRSAPILPDDAPFRDQKPEPELPPSRILGEPTVDSETEVPPNAKLPEPREPIEADFGEPPRKQS